MITRITKQNRAQYRELFESATTALQNRGYDVVVSNLEDYFANLGDLKDISPKFIRLPLDEDCFLIDLNTRKITIPASFKSIGLGVQGDHLAEVIYFKVDRYFDTTDLGAKDENKELADGVETYILWENTQGQQFLEAAYNVDITTESDKMIFGWPVSEELTKNSGNIKFSVVFIEANWNKDENVLISIEDLSYRLSTLPTTINVNTGLSFNFNTGIRILDNSELKNRITNKKPIGDAIPAPMPQMYEYNGYNWLSKEPKIYELSDLVDNEDSLKSETALTALAYPESGAGIISYEWYKNGNRIDNANSICLKYTGPRQEGRTYYTTEGSEFRILNSSDDFDELMGLNKIYEKIGFCNVTVPGEYSIKVTNRAGRSYSTIEPIGRVIIPGPTELSAVSIAVKNGDEVFVDGEELILVANVVGANAKDTLHYLWSDGSTEPELKVEAAGDYSVEVWSSRNGGTTLAAKVEDEIKIYPTASSPSIKLIASEYLEEGSNIARLTDEKVLELSVEVTYGDDVVVGKTQFEWYNENGELVGSEDKYSPQDTGLFKVVVTNLISEGNSASVEKEIKVAKI